MQPDAYGLTRGDSDLARLDLAHFIAREVLGGDYLAPVERPARVLDAGCGTGLWACEVARQLPGARVVGLDNKPTSRHEHERYRFLQGNLLGPLPFADETFDYVHQRFLTSGIPGEMWLAEVGRLVQATRPGGWVELCETAERPEPAGPAAERVYELWRQVAGATGLDVRGNVPINLGHYLAEAGAEDVVTRRAAIPVGEWAGQVGYAAARQWAVIGENLAPALERAVGIGPDAWLERVGAMLREFETLTPRPTIAVYVAYGRRPTSSARA